MGNIAVAVSLVNVQFALEKLVLLLDPFFLFLLLLELLFEGDFLFSDLSQHVLDSLDQVILYLVILNNTRLVIGSLPLIIYS